MKKNKSLQRQPFRQIENVEYLRIQLGLFLVVLLNFSARGP